MEAEIRTLNIDNIEEVKEFFYQVFSNEPWNDDWSDQDQLHAYIFDLMENRNSLSLGFFENGTMVGLSIGSIRHWYTGTEYHIDEFCIKTKEQGRGLGTKFIQAIENYIKLKGMHHIFLQTERSMPTYQFYKRNGFIELENHVSFIK